MAQGIQSPVVTLRYFPLGQFTERYKHGIHGSKIHTRIVRGSDYSPASERFARVRQTMTGNNSKLDLVNVVDAHKKIGQILTICSQGIEQKQNSDINQGPKLC